MPFLIRDSELHFNPFFKYSRLSFCQSVRGSFSVWYFHDIDITCLFDTFTTLTSRVCLILSRHWHHVCVRYFHDIDTTCLQIRRLSSVFLTNLTTIVTFIDVCVCMYVCVCVCVVCFLWFINILFNFYIYDTVIESYKPPPSPWHDN